LLNSAIHALRQFNIGHQIPPISGILWTDLFAVLKNITEIPGALDLNATFHLLAILQTGKISAADEGLRIHNARACPTPVNYRESF
jgi:hypothetical protein